MTISDREFEKKLLQTKYCTDKLTRALKECINELMVDSSERKFDQLYEQMAYISDELLPICEKMKALATGYKEASQGIINSEIKQ